MDEKIQEFLESPDGPVIKAILIAFRKRVPEDAAKECERHVTVLPGAAACAFAIRTLKCQGLPW